MVGCTFKMAVFHSFGTIQCIEYPASIWLVMVLFQCMVDINPSLFWYVDPVSGFGNPLFMASMTFMVVLYVLSLINLKVTCI